MSRHSFDADIAKSVGVNAAVIYSNITWWCERNAIKHRNIHDGNAWTFNSVKDMISLFSYLSEKQIRTALAKLENSGWIVAGNYNRDNRDRTKWYALNPGGEAFSHLVNPHLQFTKRATPTFAQKGRPLPDSKQDSRNTPIVPKGTDDLFSEKNEPIEESVKADPIEDGFEELWKAFPRKPNMPGKAVCMKEYKRALKKKSHSDLMRAAKAYAKTRVGENQNFNSRLSKWLRDENYESFLDGTVQEDAGDFWTSGQGGTKEAQPSDSDGDFWTSGQGQ